MEKEVGPVGKDLRFLSEVEKKECSKIIVLMFTRVLNPLRPLGLCFKRMSCVEFKAIREKLWPVQNNTRWMLSLPEGAPFPVQWEPPPGDERRESGVKPPGPEVT